MYRALFLLLLFFLHRFNFLFFFFHGIPQTIGVNYHLYHTKDQKEALRRKQVPMGVKGVLHMLSTSLSTEIVDWVPRVEHFKFVAR